MLHRRSIDTSWVLTLAVGVAGALILNVASAQPVVRPATVGFLSPAGAAEYAAMADAFRRGLSDVGYVENKNLTIEHRWAAGRSALLPDFAAELVRLRVDVIAAHGVVAGLAAKKATATIPIVMVATNDPVRAGLVASLARPGGNITGVGLPESIDELSGKWIQWLTELTPKLSRLAVLTNSANPTHDRRWKEVEAAGRTLRVDVHKVEMRQLDLERALASISPLKAGSLIVLPDPAFTSQRQRLAAFALDRRLPSLYMFRDFPESGGLLSYGPNLQHSFGQGAVYVGKILKGAKPADLPVEQPTKFELVINARTAKALGLTIPPPLLLRADQVLE